MSILDNIEFPSDLKDLNSQQMYVLADELRKYIIDTVSSTGGHLSSNLGVVELTLALHKTYDFSKDRLIWDVGHQSYVHKILTGRKEQFATLRQEGGISGFPKTSESIYDAFNTGHSSTSISAALGIARARDLKGENYNVVAVIGDGALTGGMAFEALNDAGRSETKLLIIINDNEMSITENVGGLSKYLNKLASKPGYDKLKRELRRKLLRIPHIGKHLINLLTRLKNSIKHLFTQDVIFDDLGLKYIGPIDGHNIKQLCEAFERANQIKGPVVLHVCTIKGKGYNHAEKRPTDFHGIAPFDIETGDLLYKSSYSNSECFCDILLDLAREDKRAVAITAAMMSGTGLKRFAEEFPDRFFDVGIAEQHAVTMAAGMAAKGMIPFCAIYSSFLQRAYDQILHDVTLQNLHVIFAIDRAGVVGEDGETHQGIYDFSFLLHLPNMTILAPSNITNMKKMFEYAFFKVDGPVAIRYPRGVLPENYESMSGEGVEICKGKISCNKALTIREGTDVSIIAAGSLVENALIAAELAASDGVSCEVIDARVIKPLDIGTLTASLNKTGKLITIEDNCIIGGFGAFVVTSLNQCGVNVSYRNLGLKDSIVQQGKIKDIHKKNDLDPVSIARACVELCESCSNCGN